MENKDASGVSQQQTGVSAKQKEPATFLQNRAPMAKYSKLKNHNLVPRHSAMLGFL